MVFLHKDFWIDQVRQRRWYNNSRRGRESARWILVTDDVDEAVIFLTDYTARPPDCVNSFPG
ncbi:MAG TPA: hypothetical protein VH352_05815 [Pseudonocardiaceae bacterium]|jgi:hypothetical protein|nr:hypothetical protein [Pseudonocardiaceae bacterium]